LIIVEVLHCNIGIDDDKLPVKSSTIATSNFLDEFFPFEAAAWRGPGDRPLKHKNINKATNKVFQPPLTVCALDHSYQQYEQAVRTSTTLSPFRHIPNIGSINDKYSTVSSGYNTASATSSGFCSHTIEDKAVPCGIPPFNGELLKPETVSPVDYRTECPVLVGNNVRLYNTKMFGSLPQHCKYMVKIRVKDASGNYRTKLVLKSTSDTDRYGYNYVLTSYYITKNLTD